MQLVRDVFGEGQPTLLLVHGGYGERSVYRNQVEFFSRTRQVVVPDLRGHGQSAKPEGPYSIAQFAEDLAELCTGLGITSTDVVGHSMGGVIAVELARQRPALVRSIATIDSPSIIPGWTERHMGPYTAAIHGPGARAMLREFLDVASSPADDPHRRQQAQAAIEAIPAHVIPAVWDALTGWDPQAALQSLEVPLLYLDHGQPHLDYEALRRHCPQLLTGQTVGAGHRALEEVPDQVNAMLDRFLTHGAVLADHARASHGSFRYKEETDLPVSS